MSPGRTGRGCGNDLSWIKSGGRSSDVSPASSWQMRRAIQSASRRRSASAPVGSGSILSSQSSSAMTRMLSPRSLALSGVHHMNSIAGPS